MFLNHFNYMHGFGLFWKVTLWVLNQCKNHCKSYWYWVIALWTLWKWIILPTFFVNRSLQMTIAGSYELENTMGSHNDALPSQISHLIKNILENLCFTHIYLSLCLGAKKKTCILQITLCNHRHIKCSNSWMLYCTVIILGSNERLHVELFNFSSRFTVNNCWHIVTEA